MIMKQSVHRWLKMAGIQITSQWDKNLSVFCLSIIVTAISIINHSFLYLLPLCISIDLSILIYAIYKNYKFYIEDMRKHSYLFSGLRKPDEDLEQKYLSEISKFPLFKDGNRFGTKKILSYISQNLSSQATSYPFYSDESIILLHNNFDEGSEIDRHTWIHEMCHCCWHNLIGIKQIATKAHTIFLTLLTITFAIVLHSWWIIFMALIIFIILFKIEGSAYIKSREEMGADAMAFTIFSKLYGIHEMKNTARKLTYRYFESLIRKTDTEKTKDTENLSEVYPLINALHNSLCFTTAEDQDRFREKLEEEIAENKNTPESKLLKTKLQALKITIYNLQQYDSFDNGFFTLNPALYYILFPILLCFASYTIIRFSIMVTIPWQCMFLSIIPIAIIIYLWVRIQQWKETKSVFLNIKINK